MSTIIAQASFNSGEWSPKLNARVDLAKYKSGAALLENFFVDYRGGASTRQGTRYVLHCGSLGSRLIPFQASFSVGYIIEIGDGYMRFYYQGAPVLERPFGITAVNQGGSTSIQAPGTGYAAGDWVYISGLGGTTQLNDQFYSVAPSAGGALSLRTLAGNPVDSSAFGAYTSGGTVRRVYTLASPYTVADNLRLIKFAQSVGQMILCHPNYPPYALSIIASTNWTLAPFSVGSTTSTPTDVAVSTTLAPGSVNYSYVVTSIDANGQESAPCSPVSLTNIQDLRSVAGTNQLSWTAQTGAAGYNIYESSVSYFGVVPVGVGYGYIGKSTGTSFIDSNIGPDFSQSPPVPRNPLVGAGVIGASVTNSDTYTVVPSVTFVGASTTAASAIAQLVLVSVPTISSGGSGYALGDTIQYPNGVVMRVVGIGGGGAVTSWVFVNRGRVLSGPVPSNPMTQYSSSGAGTGATASGSWYLNRIIMTSPGSGYIAVPGVVFSSGAATATAILGPGTLGNPTVPSFYQQRLVFAAPAAGPETFYMSKPGSYNNFDVSVQTRPSDSITGTLVSNTLNTIKAIVSANGGMLVLTDKGSWLVNGGSSGVAITPENLTANAQSFVGASDVPPIVANYDVLYVQSKGSAVRDLAFNIYFNVLTGSDISVLASHLFYGHTILEWAWAEQPFYCVWAIRDDGVMLSLTYLKEQEFIGWAHHTTQGVFQSVAAITEATPSAGTVDAVYTIVQRGGFQYIERIADRIFPNGIIDSWSVDAAIQYNGAPRATFYGATHLAGMTVTGVADGMTIPPFVMPASGTFTLPSPVSKVTVGLAFTARLKTLALDIGDPSIQSKVKKVNSVTVRVTETAGLQIGADFSSMKQMTDLNQGAVSSTLTGQLIQTTNGLITGDARTYIGAGYTTFGQYCIQQAQPYPATVLGLFVDLTLGDSP